MENTEENKNNPFVEKEEQETVEEKTEETKEEPQKDKKEEKSEDNLKQELDDINNKYLRLAADFDNYRKRTLSERESLIKYGAEETLKKIIPVLDTLARAKDSVDKTEDIEVVKQSYEICTKQFKEVLEKIGLKKIDAQGKEFDPNIMEAVMQTPTSDYPEHTVIAELQAGYQLHDRVLRPAMVNVATEGNNE